METQNFLQESLSLLSSNLRLAEWFVFGILFTIGLTIGHAAIVKKGIKKNTEIPKFNFRYWFTNNFKPIFLNYLVWFAYIFFSGEIYKLIAGEPSATQFMWIVNIVFGSKAFLSFLIGFFYDKVGLNLLIKIANFKFKKETK